MVLPLYDDNSDRRLFPWVNYAIIAINLIVFVFLQQMGEDQKFTYEFAVVPREIVTGRDIKTPDRVVEDPASGERVEVPGVQPTPIPVYFTILTAMFMHAGWAHILGNMWFLWIFGDNIEDHLGHVRYLVFYLLAGALASLAHVWMNATGEASEIPSLGASGAISGVLGAYIVQFPRRPVMVILFRVITQVPAYVAVGVWFLFQVVEGMGMLGGDPGDTGVAYAAHIGGFVSGIAMITLFDMFPWLRPKPPVVRMPGPED